MTKDELFDKVKLALRLTGTDLDDEIMDMIDEAGEEMGRLGIGEAVQTNTALGRSATIAYCRSRYAPDATDRAAYYESYQQILDSIRRSAMYAEVGPDEADE